MFKTTIEAAKFTVETPSNLNASSSAFSDLYVRSKILGKLAEIRAEKAASHVSTATVATDMLSIINATGSDKLQYWGFSYVLMDISILCLTYDILKLWLGIGRYVSISYLNIVL